MKQVKTFSEYMGDEERVSLIEREKIKFQIELIRKIVEIRKQKGLTQRDLAEVSGVKHPTIASLECMRTTPRINTLIKLLHPLGYTISIVPLNSKE